MDIAALADIHGNYIALERCLEYAFSCNVSTFFFLGDYIGELAYPERTMQILYDVNDRYKCYFIKNVSFHKDSKGGPIYWDTYVYALLNPNEAGCFD